MEFFSSQHLENNYVCPPASLVLNSVRHMMKCRAVGTVIVPQWPSAAFWPVLSPNVGSFRKYLVAHVVLPSLYDLCIAGRGQSLAYKENKRLFDGSLPFKLLALRFDFRAA